MVPLFLLLLEFTNRILIKNFDFIPLSERLRIHSSSHDDKGITILVNRFGSEPRTIFHNV